MHRPTDHAPWFAVAEEHGGVAACKVSAAGRRRPDTVRHLARILRSRLQGVDNGLGTFQWPNCDRTLPICLCACEVGNICGPRRNAWCRAVNVATCAMERPLHGGRCCLGTSRTPNHSSLSCLRDPDIFGSCDPYESWTGTSFAPCSNNLENPAVLSWLRCTVPLAVAKSLAVADASELGGERPASLQLLSSIHGRAEVSAR
jgi:hypothetical protein